MKQVSPRGPIRSVGLVVSLLLAGLWAFGGTPAVAQLRYDIKSGRATQADGWLNAQTRTVVEAPVSAEANLIRVRGKTGRESSAIAIAFLGPDGKPALAGDGKPMQTLTLTAGDLKLYGDTTVYPDAFIQLTHPMRYFVRPNMRFYKPDRRKEIFEKWDTLPAASAHEFTLEFKCDETGRLGLWFDGNFMQEYQPVAFSIVRVTLAPGAALQELSAASVARPALMALPVSAAPRTIGMDEAQLEIDPNAALPEELRPRTGEKPAGIAVQRLSQFSSMVTDDLQSYYWRRTAADELPEQRMFSVPLATYSHAYVLCATESDPAKVNAFTLRVTRYGRSRGDAMADTIVRVPAAGNDAGDANARRVGTVTYGAAGARKSVPLWLLKVPIRNGLIQDLLYQDERKSDVQGTHKYLDVELMDPLHHVEQADAFPPPMEPVQRGWIPSSPDYTGYDFYTAQSEPQTSGVTVFGLALEESPAQLQVRSNIGHQAFYTADKPQFDAKIMAAKAGEYVLAWEYADVDGTIVTNGQKSIRLAEGAAGTVSAPVEQQGNGWYAARFRLSSGGNELVDYRTAFVMLPPDTRKAGLESPFYGWWFGKNHGSDVKLDEVGPLLQRLGIRRTDLPEDMPESVTLPKYGFTNATVPFAYRGGGKALSMYRDGQLTLAEAVAIHEEHIRQHLTLWPSIDRMLVFHESGAKGAPFPSELWGEPATNQKHIEDENSPEALLRQGGTATAAQQAARAEWEKNWPKRIEYLTAMAEMVRAKFPGLKMQYGNDGNSMGILGELFRQKFPRRYIDTIASEDLGQTVAPERDRLGSTQDGWYVRELARQTGYGDVPVTATTEWIGRMTLRLGRRKQAEWKARDALIALGYGYDTISIAGINDAGDGYFYSIWANGGLNERYPIMAPKPAYAAIATLTRVLDRAEHQRFVPTGSTVCYLQEFRRDGEYIYAVWTPRGEREVTLAFPDAAPRTRIDLYGRESAVSDRDVKLSAGTAVQYLVSPTRLATATLGTNAFPDDAANVPEKPLELIALESRAVIDMASDKLREKGTANADVGKLIEGDFEIREVVDPEMGKCIEVELKRNGRQPRLGEVEYVTLKLAKPVTTTAKNAGVWIKGNGSWGEVDIVKNHWGPWADNGNLHMNWPGDASMNFEGWNFIKYPYYDWVHTDGVYATTVVSGLRISFPRTTLVGTERVPVENQTVRIKSILLF